MIMNTMLYTISVNIISVDCLQLFHFAIAVEFNGTCSIGSASCKKARKP